MNRPRWPLNPGDLGMIAALAAAVLAVYWSVATFEFTSYDDPDYALNPHVTGGLTAGNVGWAFSTTYHSHWQPLVWLSYMADVQFFRAVPGPTAAGAHHLVNLALHIVSTILVFLVLRRLTRAAWPSAAVAVFFGVHPLHVESVAWITERKDVLSAVFWLLAIGAYAWYARRPAVGRYLVVFLMLALGLMAKPMLVTVPFVLLLLDYWPLGRIRIGERLEWGLGGGCHAERSEASRLEAGRDSSPPPAGAQNDICASGVRPGRLVLEKVPLFILVAVISVVTYVAQQRTGAMMFGDGLSFGTRLSSAVVAYTTYIIKTFCPTGLAVIYPYETDLPAWQVAGSAVLLVAITALVLWQGRRRPYLPVGWFWYLGTLVPVIGIVQVGVQSMADRYTYVPLIGIFIMVAWGAADIVAAWPQTRRAVSGLAIAAVLVLVWAAHVQVQYWRNSETLYTRALAVTHDNAIAENNLGLLLAQRGQYEKALPHCREALRLKPEAPEAHLNMGLALMGAAQTMSAPEADRATDEAIAEYRVVLESGTNEQKVRGALAQALIVKHRYAEAVEQADLALALNPDDPVVHYNRGVALGKLGRTREAVLDWREVMRLRPDDVRTALALAWVLSTDPDPAVRNGADALAIFQEVLKGRGQADPNVLDTLAAIYAELNRFKEAADMATAAEAAAYHIDNKKLAVEIHARLLLYQAGKPYRAKPVTAD